MRYAYEKKNGNGVTNVYLKVGVVMRRSVVIDSRGSISRIVMGRHW